LDDLLEVLAHPDELAGTEAQAKRHGKNDRPAPRRGVPW